MNETIILALSIFSVLIIASMSGLLSEKSGVVNVGVEGMMTMGALLTGILSTLFNKFLPDLPNKNLYQFAVIPLSALLTGIFAMLHAIPSIKLKADQVVSSMAINILAISIGIYFATSKLFGTENLVIKTGFDSVNIFKYVPIIFIIAALLVISVFIFFKFTKTGMRYTMVGENPKAIHSNGINVNKYRYWAVFFSGVFAGISGSMLILSVVTENTFRGTTFGYGFLAMAIMIFGQWKIHYIFIGSVLFSALFTVSQNPNLVFTEMKKFVNIDETITQLIINNKTLFQALPYVFTILSMIIFSKKSKAPAALGIPFTPN